MTVIFIHTRTQLAFLDRNTGPEGWRLRQRHFETLTSLVQHCRKFFPSGSASEIWSEFRYDVGLSSVQCCFSFFCDCAFMYSLSVIWHDEWPKYFLKLDSVLFISV